MKQKDSRQLKVISGVLQGRRVPSSEHVPSVFSPQSDNGRFIIELLLISFLCLIAGVQNIGACSRANKRGS